MKDPMLDFILLNTISPITKAPKIETNCNSQGAFSATCPIASAIPMNNPATGTNKGSNESNTAANVLDIVPIKVSTAPALPCIIKSLNCLATPLLFFISF